MSEPRVSFGRVGAKILGCEPMSYVYTIFLLRSSPRADLTIWSSCVNKLPIFTLTRFPGFAPLVEEGPSP